DFDQIGDLESARTQQPDAVAMRDVELDAILVRPLEPMHPELAAQQSLGGWSSVSKSGTQSMLSTLLPRAMSSPPLRRRRAVSGIHRYGSHQIAAPYSLIARSKLPSGYGTSSAFPRTSGKVPPCSRCMRRAVSSCRGELSIATGCAPRRASQPLT